MVMTRSKYGRIEAGCDSMSKDRLSDLPDEILVHILYFLPIKDAVRTILLRRFGNLWTLHPTLQFHYHCDSPNFISNVMKFHKNNTIHTWEFTLEYDEHEFDLCENKLRKWIRLALCKNPKVFGLSLELNDWCHLKLPRIYTSQSITILKLAYVVMNLPSRVNMRSLRRLELVWVQIDEADLKVLEVGCPCLRELSIESHIGLRKVHFTAPNIESLELHIDVDDEDELHSLDCPNLKYLHIKEACLQSIEFIDLSSVTHARIDSDAVYRVTDHQFRILHEKFQNANFFQLSDYGDVLYIKRSDGDYRWLGDKVCMQLEQCGNEMLVFQLNNWSLLALKSGVQRSYLLGIFKLLRNSRFLEELTLYVNLDFFSDYNLFPKRFSCPCKMQ